LFDIGRFILEEVGPHVFKPPKSKHLFWNDLQAVAQRLTSNDPTARPSVQQVLKSDFFVKNALINVVEVFLKDIRAVAQEAKVLQFRFEVPDDSDLSAKLRCLPEPTIEGMVFPHLLTAEMFIEPGATSFFEELFGQHYAAPQTNEPLISRKMYIDNIIPFINSLFQVKQLETRCNLLTLIKSYPFV
jgi:hypothetical protein